MYIARRTREEGEEGRDLLVRRCLSEKASQSLSQPSASVSVRSEMAPMGSHESQIKWIVLVSFSPSSSGRCRCRGHCRFPHRRDVGTERQTNERTTTTTTGQLLQRPIKLLNREKLIRLRSRLHSEPRRQDSRSLAKRNLYRWIFNENYRLG